MTVVESYPSADNAGSVFVISERAGGRGFVTRCTQCREQSKPHTDRASAREWASLHVRECAAALRLV